MNYVNRPLLGLFFDIFVVLCYNMRTFRLRGIVVVRMVELKKESYIKDIDIKFDNITKYIENIIERINNNEISSKGMIISLIHSYVEYAKAGRLFACVTDNEKISDNYSKKRENNDYLILKNSDSLKKCDSLKKELNKLVRRNKKCDDFLKLKVVDDLFRVIAISSDVGNYFVEKEEFVNVAKQNAIEGMISLYYNMFYSGKENIDETIRVKSYLNDYYEFSIIKELKIDWYKHEYFEEVQFKELLDSLMNEIMVNAKCDFEYNGNKKISI